MRVTALTLPLAFLVRAWSLRFKGRFDPSYFSDEYGSMAAGGTQENMLKDAIRVSSYQKAITGNPTDFRGKHVMDVGAGTGLLSFFAAQAGAAKVYSVEVSKMAEVERALVASNHFPNIAVFNRAVEDMQQELDQKVDVLVSEPFGELLFHERMIESYLYARDHFLKPGGKMFPNAGQLHLAPFSDATMHAQYHYLRPDSVGLADAEAPFWSNASFYGINLTAAAAFVPARSRQQGVIMDLADPASLLAAAAIRDFDFETLSRESLRHIEIPLDFEVRTGGLVHGLVGWFDAMFAGSDATVTLSTAPWCPPTHWWQVHLLMKEPLVVQAGDHILGEVTMEADDAHMSYRVSVTMRVTETGAASGPQHFNLFEWWFRPEDEESNWAMLGQHATQGDDRCLSGEPLVAQP